jgi:hypothetical protein
MLECYAVGEYPHRLMHGESAVILHKNPGMKICDPDDLFSPLSTPALIRKHEKKHQGNKGGIPAA